MMLYLIQSHFTKKAVVSSFCLGQEKAIKNHILLRSVIVTALSSLGCPCLANIFLKFVRLSIFKLLMRPLVISVERWISV